jgi:hypothetical protein
MEAQMKIGYFKNGKLRRGPGVQVSIRFPKAALAKLERLSEKAVQSKSQYLVKLIQELPDPTQ